MSGWYCIDIVRRNSVLVIHGSQGLNMKCLNHIINTSSPRVSSVRWLFCLGDLWGGFETALLCLNYISCERGMVMICTYNLIIKIIFIDTDTISPFIWANMHLFSDIVNCQTVCFVVLSCWDNWGKHFIDSGREEDTCWEVDWSRKRQVNQWCFNRELNTFQCCLELKKTSMYTLCSVVTCCFLHPPFL